MAFLLDGRACMSAGDRPESMSAVNAPHAMGMQAGGGNIQHNYYYAQALAERPTSLRRYRVGVVPQLADCRQDREIDRVLAAEQPGIPCQVLTGPGGVGKTQLAASLARQADGEPADLGHRDVPRRHLDPLCSGRSRRRWPS